MPDPMPERRPPLGSPRLDVSRILWPTKFVAQRRGEVFELQDRTHHDQQHQWPPPRPV